MKNYYQILDINENATQDEVKKQYRFMIQAWHPDKFPNIEQKGKAEQKTMEINEAYGILGNPEKRREYDKFMGFAYKKTHQTKNETNQNDNRSTQKNQPPIQSRKRISNFWVVFGILSVIFCVCLISSGIDSLNQNNQPVGVTTTVTITKHTEPKSPTSSAINNTSTPSVVFPNDNNMTLIPSGDFTMGNNSSANNERPTHVVFIESYYIDKYEVTNSMYQKCVNDEKCRPPTRVDSPSSLQYFGNPEYDDYPVIYVTWYMAETYCKSIGSRLPTEAEWEKAARGQDERIYPWGNEFTEGKSNFCDANCLKEWANENFNDGYPYTAPIGTFPFGQSPYGVFDMVGNVYEWVADWYSESYYSSSSKDNPKGPITGQDRVIRGGAWSDVLSTSSISRASFSPESSYEFLGFRCARSSSE